MLCGNGVVGDAFDPGIGGEGFAFKGFGKFDLFRFGKCESGVFRFDDRGIDLWTVHGVVVGIGNDRRVVDGTGEKCFRLIENLGVSIAVVTVLLDAET
ncbi:hypothetical protein SDC9_207883 [bioreactor metagenome]|uniref:Uncharacterized protein n=1 Tax=bioreactor metagenome TaxID=1076179 RepID=A0A645J923_9ZZZZ